MMFVKSFDRLGFSRKFMYNIQPINFCMFTGKFFPTTCMCMSPSLGELGELQHELENQPVHDVQ